MTPPTVPLTQLRNNSQGTGNWLQTFHTAHRKSPGRAPVSWPLPPRERSARAPCPAERAPARPRAPRSPVLIRVPASLGQWRRLPAPGAELRLLPASSRPVATASGLGFRRPAEAASPDPTRELRSRAPSDRNRSRSPGRGGARRGLSQCSKHTSET